MLGLRLRLATAIALAVLGGRPAAAIREHPASAPAFSFAHYGPEQGLSSPAVRALLQDRDGFLWVGTADGLFRFDGDRFLRFGRGEGLPSAAIADLAETPSGELWVATELGLARRSGERFVAVRLGPFSPERTVAALAVGCRGELLVGGPAGVFAQAEQDRFEPLFAGAFGWRTRALAVDCGRQVVWIGGEHGLASWDGSTLTLRPLRLADAPRIDSMAFDRAGRLWLRTRERLFRLDAENSSPVAEDAGLPPAGERGALLIDSRGELWVPTESGLAHRRDLRWEVFDRRNGLAADAIRAVIEDRDGRLWIGHQTGGLDRWLGRGAWQKLDQATGLAHDAVHAVLRGADGELWVATAGGLDRLSADGTTWRHFGAEDGLGDGSIAALALDRAGGLWIGGGDGGVARLRRGAIHIEAWWRSAEPGGAITGLLVDDRERLWITSLRGLWTADLTRQPLRPRRVALPAAHDDAAAGAGAESLYGIAFDRRGVLWLAGRQGLVVGDGGRWRRIEVADGLRDACTAHLALDGDGAVWVSYGDEFGISRVEILGVDPLADPVRVTHRSRADGLASDMAHVLGGDARGRLWVGTALGLDVLDGSRVEHYGPAQGVPAAGGFSDAFLVDRDRSLWLGTPRGLLHTHPDLLDRLPAESAPNATLTAAGASGDDGFRARFTAPVFSRAADLRFRYVLEGFESEPNETAAREVSYRHLPPGEYRFAIDARVGDGEWSARPAVFAFAVAPRWWQTAPARLGLGGFCLLALLVGERALHRVLRRRALQLEELVARRTREAREASITDPLTGARNRRYFQEVLPGEAQRIARHYRRGDPRHDDALLLCMVDLDRFKSVNDTYGHHAGDEVLRECAARLRACLREEDLLIRWGGEEFLVIFRDCQRNRGQHMAQRLVRAVRRGTVRVRDRELAVTCSVGWSLYPWFTDRPKALSLLEALEIADLGLYAAKRQGRDRACAVEAPTAWTPEREAAIRAALRGGVAELAPPPERERRTGSRRGGDRGPESADRDVA